jgi:hypothetical protein
MTQFRPWSWLFALLTVLFLVGGCGSNDNGIVSIEPGTVSVSITPSRGPVAGGTSVTFTGPFANQVTGVTIGGNPVTNLQIVNETTATALTPAHAAGTVDVVFQSSFGNAVIPNGYTYLDIPTVTSLVPTLIPLTGANGLVLTGTGFVPDATSVNLDGVAYAPVSVTPTSITLNAPAHAAGTVPVSVTTPGGTSQNLTGGLTYTAAPTLTSILPAAGPLAGRNNVVLTGTGFIVGSTTLTLDGNNLIPVSVTPTTITFNAPAHAAGTVPVAVTTPGGTSANLAGGFTYTAGPTVSTLTPARGPLSGRTGVVLSGTVLVAGSTTVNFDGSAITPTAVTATSLTFDAPAHTAGTVAVSVTTPGGTSTEVAGGFTYLEAPTVTAINPTAGPLSGVTGVVLSGTNFVDGALVQLDGAPITPLSINPTSLIFNAPAHAAGTVTIAVITPGGTSADLTGGFTYTEAPVVEDLTPNIGPLTGVKNVTLSGSGFVNGQTTVHVGSDAIVPTAVTPTLLTFDVPAHAAGTVTVNVTTPGGTSSNVVDGFTYAEGPTAGTLTPAAGPLSGRTGIILSGSGFVAGNTTINFGGLELTPTALTPTSLTFDAPAQAAPGAVSVSVNTPGGTSPDVVDGYTYAAVPTISDIDPNAIPTAGQNDIVINGSGFLDGLTTVTLDGQPITPTTVSENALIFNAPGHAQGPVSITVQTPGGTTAPATLTYVAAPTLTSLSPDSVGVTGNTNIILTGTNFTADSTVTVDGSPVTVYFTSSNQLIIFVPDHAAGAVPVVVTTVGGDSAPLNFTYVAGPTASSLEPDTVSVDGGDQVTVTGGNFRADGLQVVVDTTPVTATRLDDSTLTFLAPPHLAGTATIRVVNNFGTSIVPEKLTYTSDPILYSVTPNVATLGAQSVLTVKGTNFSDSSLNIVPSGGGRPVIPDMLSRLDSRTIEISIRIFNAGSYDIVNATGRLTNAFTVVP